MADQDEIIKQTYALEIDELRLNRLKIGVSEARKLIESTTAAVKAQPVVLNTAANAIDNYAQKLEESDMKLVDAVDNIDTMTSDLLDLENAAQSAAEAQDELAKSNERVSKSADEGVGGGSGRFGGQSLFGPASQVLNQAAPGLGQSVSLVGQLVSSLGEVGPIALVAAPAIAGVSFVLGEMQKQAEESRKQLLSNLDVQGQYYALVNSGSTDEVKNKRDELIKQQQDAESQLAVLDGLPEKIRAQVKKIQESYVGDEGAFSGSLQDQEIQRLLQPFKDQLVELGVLSKDQAITADTANDLDNRIKDLQKSSQSAAFWADKYTKALDDGTVKSINAADKLKQVQDQYAKNIVASIEGPLKAQAEYQAFISTATTEDLDKRRKAAADAKELTAQEIVALEQRKSSAEAGSKAYEALQTEIDTLYRQYNDQVDAYTLLTSSSAKATAAENTLAQTREKQIAAVKKYDNDLDAIDQKDYEARAGIAQRYSDTLVKIAENAATSAENALQKLTDQRDKLAQDLARADATAEQQAQMQSLNEQIKFQQQSARSAREHAREVAQIQRDAQKNEQKLIDDRDFAGLFEARQGVASAIQASNEKYDQERADALEAYSQQNEDRERQFKFETEQRHKKEQQDIADAQAAYNKELQQANRARQAALDAAVRDRDRQYSLQTGKYNSELNLRKSAILSELSMIQQGNALKLAADQIYINQLKQLLATMPSPNASAGNNTATSTSGRVSPTKDFDNSSGRIRAGAGASQSIGAGGKGAVTINGPLVAPTINAGGANAAQMAGIEKMIFNGALQALQIVTGVQVNK